MHLWLYHGSWPSWPQVSLCMGLASWLFHRVEDLLLALVGSSEMRPGSRRIGCRAQEEMVRNTTFNQELQFEQNSIKSGFKTFI